MRTKYGFNGGGAVPDGAEIYRAVYIRAINKLAEQLGSRVRAVAYDRAGVHNWCLILFHGVNDSAGRTPDELTESLDLSAAEVLDPDEVMVKPSGRRTSGSSVCGKIRLSKRGSARLRSALCFPAIVAQRHNPISRLCPTRAGRWQAQVGGDCRGHA